MVTRCSTTVNKYVTTQTWEITHVTDKHEHTASVGWQLAAVGYLQQAVSAAPQPRGRSLRNDWLHFLMWTLNTLQNTDWCGSHTGTHIRTRHPLWPEGLNHDPCFILFTLHHVLIITCDNNLNRLYKRDLGWQYLVNICKSCLITTWHNWYVKWLKAQSDFFRLVENWSQKYLFAFHEVCFCPFFVVWVLVANLTFTVSVRTKPGSIKETAKYKSTDSTTKRKNRIGSNSSPRSSHFRKSAHKHTQYRLTGPAKCVLSHTGHRYWQWYFGHDSCCFHAILNHGYGWYGLKQSDKSR